MQFSTLPPAVPLIREGKLRALATTGAKRVALLQDVPTLAEAGLSTWLCGWALRRRPVRRLNRELTDVLVSTEIREALLQQGMVAEPGPPSALGRSIAADLETWRDVVARLGNKPE